MLVLILVFYPRRSYLTWAGAGLAGLVLVTAAALPLATAPKALEVTCLDAYGGLEGVVVSPENRRLVVSAAAPPRWGRPAPGWGPLPGYLPLAAVPAPGPGHRLEPERGQRRGTAHPGPAVQRRVILVRPAGPGQGRPIGISGNYLGDRGAAPRSLERGRPPAALGRVALKYVKLAPDVAPGPGSRLSGPAGSC